MLSTKRKAATSAEATAPKYNRLSQSYQDSASTSREKLQIGTLLLALQRPLSHKQQKICWVLFEALLRQYLDMKISGGMV